MADKIFNLTNGVSFGARYTVLSGDVAIPEVITITVTAGCTSNGNLSIVLRGAGAVTIAVTTAADLPSEVATLIQGGTYTGWVATVNGAVVTFTATTAGDKTGANTLGVASTGVTGTVAVATTGTDGSVTFAFRSTGVSTEVAYPIAATIQVVTAANVYAPITDAVITYPANGKVKIADGASTFTLVAGQKISVIAQRADIVAG